MKGLIILKEFTDQPQIITLNGIIIYLRLGENIFCDQDPVQIAKILHPLSTVSPR